MPRIHASGTLFGMLDAEQFADQYDILRNELPVRLAYSPDADADSGRTQLMLLQLQTGDEPVGGGLAEWPANLRFGQLSC